MTTKPPTSISGGSSQSLKLRSEGYSAHYANGLAYDIEVIGYVGDGTADHADDKAAKKELAKYSREVWKFHCDRNNKKK